MNVSMLRISRYPELYYTPEGHEFKERLWEETMDEFQNC